MAKIKVLKEHPLFREFSDREIAVVSQMIGERSFPAGTALFAEGTPGDSLLLLKAGCVEIRKRSAAGEEALGRLGPGELLGGLSLFGEGPRACTAWTVEPVEVLMLAAEDFQVLMEKEPAASVKLAVALMRELTTRLRSDLQALVSAARGTL